MTAQHWQAFHSSLRHPALEPAPTRTMLSGPRYVPAAAEVADDRQQAYACTTTCTTDQDPLVSSLSPGEG